MLVDKTTDEKLKQPTQESFNENMMTKTNAKTRTQQSLGEASKPPTQQSLSNLRSKQATEQNLDTRDPNIEAEITLTDKLFKLNESKNAQLLELYQVNEEKRLMTEKVKDLQDLLEKNDLEISELKGKLSFQEVMLDEVYNNKNNLEKLSFEKTTFIEKLNTERDDFAKKYEDSQNYIDLLQNDRERIENDNLEMNRLLENNNTGFESRVVE